MHVTRAHVCVFPTCLLLNVRAARQCYGRPNADTSEGRVEECRDSRRTLISIIKDTLEDRLQKQQVQDSGHFQ